MTFNATIANYASDAYLEYYRNDGIHYLRDEAANAGFPNLLTYLSSDIHDNYKQGNLAEVFPSMLNLADDAYSQEASYIDDARSEIAQRIHGLLTNELIPKD